MKKHKLLFIATLLFSIIACNSNKSAVSKDEQFIKDTINSLQFIKDLSSSVESFSNQKQKLDFKIEKPTEGLEYWSVQVGVKEAVDFDVFVQMYYNINTKEIVVEDNFSGNKIPFNEWENQNDDSNYLNSGIKLLENELLGGLKLGMPINQVISIIGEPEEKEESYKWETDGLFHQDWKYAKKGIILNISWDKPSNETIFSMTVSKPCNLKTSRNVGIGSSRFDVLKNYHSEIDAKNVQFSSIIAGSVYAGIIFSFENNVVSEIFIGAAAE